MRHIHLLTLSFLLCCGSAFSQSCFYPSITLNTQEQVDNFATDYPNCTELHSLQIVSSPGPITNLIGLRQITTAGYCRIGYNPELTSLDGLENITTASNLIIDNNDKLVNLSGLENLDYAGSGIEIKNNDNLTDISTLSSVTSSTGVYIRNNPKLTNLTGLENLSIPDYSRTISIAITNNATLSDISGLDILLYYSSVKKLELYENPLLSVCSYEGICYYLGLDQPSDIYDNAVGCNSSDEILSACESTTPICPSGDITFSSQAQIDNFPTDYPGCTNIPGNLTISANDINDLSGLKQVATVEKSINICDNPILTSLDGLKYDGITAGEGLSIKNNDALTRLQHTILFNGQLRIEDNAVLESLRNIDDFNLENRMTFLKITNNPNLLYCTIMFNGDRGICDYLADGGPNEIYNNAPGCDSAADIINNCTYFPIELTDFQAKVQNKTVLLTWETATENNNAGFEIQRSKDGTTWDRIAWQEGQGTSTILNRYTHTDKNPLFGRSYYRLKQIDFDGTSDYSDLVTVNYRNTTVSIYPNPVKETLYINAGNIQHLSIYDQAGRLVKTQNTSENTIDLSTLPSGIYILKVSIENSVFYERFVK